MISIYLFTKNSQYIFSISFEFRDVFIFDACIGFYFYPLAEVVSGYE